MKGLLLGALLGLLVAVFLSWPPPPLAEHVREWKNNGKYFNFKGHSIFYRDDVGASASGRTLVVLHGFPTSSYDWRKIWPGLLQDWNRIVAPDFLGFGFSDKPTDHAYSIMEQADMVEGLLGSLGLPEVHLLAHDYGDTVAQELLHRHNSKKLASPITLRSVCLLNGGMFPETHQPILVQTLGAHPVAGPILSRLAFYHLFSKNIGRVFGPDTQPSAGEMADFWAIFSHKAGFLASRGLLQYISERHLNRDRWVGALQEATVPVCTIYGVEDIINPRPFIDYYRKIIPRPELTVLEGVGHYPQFEAPERVLRAYRDFVATLP